MSYAALITLILSLGAQDARDGLWYVERSVAEFDRFSLTEPELEAAVRANGETRVESAAVAGAVECDFVVPETGWYELFANPEGGLNEFVIDGAYSVFAGERSKGAEDGPWGKVDNLWLARGRHTVRVQRYIWWGFWPPLKGVALQRSDGSLPKSLRVEYAHGPGEAVLRRGDDLALTVETGGRSDPAPLTVQLVERASGRVESQVTVELPATEGLATTTVQVPCPSPGIYALRFVDGETHITPRDLRPMTVYVIDGTPVPHSGGDPRRTLVCEIDCAEQPPDFVSGGEARVISTPLGRYRQSGSSGFLPAQHQRVPASWFAYRISTPDVGRPHVLEVDYPDDAYRTFLIVIRESSADDYPVAAGVDSGGCWSLTNAMQTQSVLFWPKTTEPRVAFLAAHDGIPAAAARVRVYRVDEEIPPLDVPVVGGRTFVNWYEEGTNFTGFYGGTKHGLDGYLRSADTWPRALSHMGGNLLVPTVSVYQMSLYPSRYNHHHAEMTTPDVFRLILLNCERYGLRLAGEFHPEARELNYPSAEGGLGPTGMASRNGQVGGYGRPGPLYHPLHPRNQEWYLGMVGEFVDRYKDSPAFAGVSLRCMSWANPALNNFHSLEWGYDDLTVGMFERETGTAVPGAADDPNRFAVRFDWLTTTARDRWVTWRCEKITELHERIAARVREARDDLQVYLTVFDLGEDAGLDPERLSGIRGLTLVNCKHSYGRRARTYEGHLADQRMRDNLLDPAVLSSLRTGSHGAAFIFGAGYFEATESILTPVELGLPEDAKRTWISGVVNPAGRHYLERYAVALAETDALLLGDEGNAYTLGQPLLREFMREFRCLPPVPFAPRPDARDPVAVWELSSDDEFLFYVVNREGYAVDVELRIEGARAVGRLSTGEELDATGGRLALRLLPYQLLAFQAPRETRIAGIRQTVPEGDRARVEAMVDAAERLLADAAGGGLPADAAGVELLRHAVAEARQCLAEGRLWRASTLLENHRLAEQAYGPLGATPPGLEYLLGVVQPAY